MQSSSFLGSSASNTCPFIPIVGKNSVVEQPVKQKEGCGNGVFIDWFSASQFHTAGRLPLLVDGLVGHFDRDGNCRFEFPKSTSVRGSYDSSVRVLCDGWRVLLSGNVGRFGREDNLFNHGWPATVAAANRILAMLGLPAFTGGERFPGRPALAAEPDRWRDVETWGATVSRLDLTCNYRTGSDSQARALIRWLSSRSVARMKRGYSSDESCWFVNTRHMLKAYRKGAEMRKHGGNEEAAAWAEEQGILRVEVELKKRLLSELGLNQFDAITDEALVELFNDQTEIFRAVDRSDEPDILDAIPMRYRTTAAAWLAGRDVRAMLSNGSLYRQAKILREYGIDILEARDILQFPTKTRVIDLEPMTAPDWYNWKVAA